MGALYGEFLWGGFLAPKGAKFRPKRFYLGKKGVGRVLNPTTLPFVVGLGGPSRRFEAWRLYP